MEKAFLNKFWHIFLFHLFLPNMCKPEVGFICTNSPNHWNTNVLTVFTAQSSTNFTKQFFTEKNVFIGPQSSLFSSSYECYGVKQSMNRVTLHICTLCHFFLFSSWHIEHTVFFFFLASGIPRVLFLVQRLIVWQPKSCFNDFFWGSPLLFLHSRFVKYLAVCWVIQMQLWKEKFESVPSNCILGRCVAHWFHCWPVIACRR